MPVTSQNTRGDLSYLLDETDKGVNDCRSCIVNGNKVSLFVKGISGNRNADFYVRVSDAANHTVQYKLAITDPGSVEALFNWINLTSIRDGFAFMLQNGLVQNQVVGVEKFANGEPLSLQLQQLSGVQNPDHVIYVKPNSSEYFALYLRSPEGHLFYILPKDGALKIYDVTRLANDNLFVFRIGTYMCPNDGGSCPFQRLMRKY